MVKRCLLLLAVVWMVGAMGVPGSAAASAAAPGWEIFSRVDPANLAPGGSGVVELFVFNTGAAVGEYPTITDTLPAGVTSSGGSLSVNDILNGIENQKEGGECTGSGSVVTCTAAKVSPGAVMEVSIDVNVEASVASGSEGLNRATAAGGGALSPASESNALKFNSTPAGFGFNGFDAWFTSANGTSDTQAGSHPYELSVAYSVNSTGQGFTYERPSGGEIRDLAVNLPPGIVGNPTAVPRCTRKQFDGEIALVDNGTAGYEPTCPPSTQVGVDLAYGEGLPVAFKVYNLVPPPGVAAQFGFDWDGAPVFLDAGVRSGGSTPLANDYGISEHVDNVPEHKVSFNVTTIWGVPSEESHLLQRGGESSGAAPTPFLTLPTSCEGPQEFSIEAFNTWQSESTSASTSVLTHDNSGTPTGLTGCDHLGFEPTIAVAPDTTHADTPAGLGVDVEAPQQGQASAEGLSTSNIKDTTVDAAGRRRGQPGAGRGARRLPGRRRRQRRRRSAVVPAGVESRDGRNRNAAAVRQAAGQRLHPAVEPAGTAAAGRGLRGWREPEARRRRAPQRSDRATRDDVRGNPGAAVHELQAVLQRRCAGGAGDTHPVRHLHDDVGFHAVEHPAGAGRLPVFELRRSTAARMVPRVRIRCRSSRN